MTPKQIEKLARAAHEVCDASTTMDHEQHCQELAAVLNEVDPRGLYRGNSIRDELAERRAEEPYVPLRDSPRLPRLIGEHEAGTHD
jgi:hypothetical protein